MWLGWGDFSNVGLIHCCRFFLHLSFHLRLCIRYLLLFRAILTASDSFVYFQFHACARLVLVNNRVLTSRQPERVTSGLFGLDGVGWGGVGWGVGCVCVWGDAVRRCYIHLLDERQIVMQHTQAIINLRRKSVINTDICAHIVY